MSEQSAEVASVLHKLSLDTGIPISDIIMGVCRFLGEATAIQQKTHPKTTIEKVLQLLQNSVTMEYQIAKEKLKDIPTTTQDLTKH